MTSDYFDNNPGSHERIPSISKMIPTLSTEKAAKHIVRALDADSDERIRPLIMKIILIFARIAPRLSAWLNAKTGWQRPPELP